MLNTSVLKDSLDRARADAHGVKNELYVMTERCREAEGESVVLYSTWATSKEHCS